MSDLLTRMTERTLGLAPTLQPKLTSTYESSPMLGDSLAAAYAPDVMGDPGAGLTTGSMGTMAQTNTVVVPRSNVPTPMLVAAQPNLEISRLSHNLSGVVWQDAPSPVSASDSTAAPVTSIDSSVPEMVVTPAVSLGVTNLAIDPPTLLPSQPATPEIPNEIAEPLTTRDLVPQSSDPFPVTTNSPVSEQSELITKSELITIRENSPLISSSSPLPIGSPVNLVTNVTQMPAANQNNLTPATPSGTSEAIKSQPLISSRERVITQISTAGIVPAIPLGTSEVIESQPLIPSRERVITQISTASPVTANQPLVSISERKAVQTLVPIAVRPLERPLATPATQISSQPIPPTTAPTIQVKIGRIEIRAVTTPPPAAPPKSRPSSSVPQLSLADYLKSRGSST
jgi:hypothetical protein